MHRIVAIVFGFTILKPQFTILSQILRASQSHSFIDSTSHYPDSRVKHAQHRYNKDKKLQSNNAILHNSLGILTTLEQSIQIVSTNSRKPRAHLLPSSIAFIEKLVMRMNVHLHMLHFLLRKETRLCNLFRIHLEFHILLDHQNMVNFILTPGVVASRIVVDSQHAREIIHRQLIALNSQLVLELSDSRTNNNTP